ncbi:MAG: hypothetical protein IPL35_13870 [Sphingobacteriales bacterium]|nr:hypothetical protein [Sphingobacteriales bacterium]
MGKPHKKRSRSSPTFFDGVAVIDTKGRKDSCEIWGGLDKADGKEIHFQLRPFNDHHPVGFNLNSCEGRWNGNTLDLSAGFSWFREDGSSFSDSADPRYDYKGKLLMSRRTQQ